MIRRYPLAVFFVIACGLSWLIWAPLWLPAVGVSGLPTLPYHHALGALGPIAAAFLVSGAVGGRASTGDLARRMVLWRGRAVWVLVALLAPFALLALAMSATSLLGEGRGSLARLGTSREFPELSAIAFLTYNIVSFGLGEEVGWRGFALPRLQARHNALTSSLLLTVGWALWHIPLFAYRPGYTGMGAAGVAGWLFSLVTGSILLTWLYNESEGSLLTVALFHASMDVVFTTDGTSPMVVNAIGALTTLWGVVIVIVAGPRFLSRKGKMVWGRAGVTEMEERHPDVVLAIR
ncbi:MAG: CPBP family intramembrane metalloprotease [Cytophagaceae bacterium]|nr:CPBP family intramembrane metalloprotease [Gemmatimonadaceae bacterium]